MSQHSSSLNIIPQQDTIYGNNSNPSSPSSPASVGSLDALDEVDDDLNRNEYSRARGYFGKRSEITWMRNLCKGLGSLSSEKQDESDRSNVPEGDSPNQLSHYPVEPVDYPAREMGGIYVLPDKDSATRLFNLYMDTVHPSLPVLRSDLFVDQFDSFFSGTSQHPGRKWLALLNLIFAISTKLCQLFGQDVFEVGYKFFSRAQALNISESIVEDHEDLQQVQVEILASFYLLIASHVNR